MNTTLLTANDVSIFLKISKALAYRLIAEGKIPAIRFGRTVRVRADDLEAFLDNHHIGDLLSNDTNSNNSNG
ncbi:helix-turn-helix domain-containing protein [Chloroflexota bacterium]